MSITLILSGLILCTLYLAASIWPDIDIIIKHFPEDFIKKYPNNMVIVDATELKIQVPSSLQKHSETYSTSKSHKTFNSLIGVDPNGGIMFVSQLLRVPFLTNK